MKTLKIRTTPHDREYGIPCSPWGCALSRAISRADRSLEPSVCHNGVYVTFNNERIHLRLPPVAMSFASAFDKTIHKGNRWEDVEDVEFPLEIGEEPESVRPHMRRKRTGYTLIETLVVMAILGVLSAFLVSGVGAVREAASRTACDNNLRQLTLACVNYAISNGRWPSAGTGWNGSVVDGWAVQTASYWGRAETIHTCPNRGVVEHGGRCTSYAAAIPVGHVATYVPAPITPADRPSYPSRVECSRGNSNTSILSHTWQQASNVGTTANYHLPWRAGFGMGTVRTTIYPPRPDSTRGDFLDYGFGGPHRGISAGHADGSVRRYSFDVDPDLWRELARR